jgi:hypothetical protein
VTQRFLAEATELLQVLKLRKSNLKLIRGAKLKKTAIVLE